MKTKKMDRVDLNVSGEVDFVGGIFESPNNAKLTFVKIGNGGGGGSSW
jgi:hypothetical protein